MASAETPTALATIRAGTRGSSPRTPSRWPAPRTRPAVATASVTSPMPLAGPQGDAVARDDPLVDVQHVDRGASSSGQCAGEEQSDLAGGRIVECEQDAVEHGGLRSVSTRGQPLPGPCCGNVNAAPAPAPGPIVAPLQARFPKGGLGMRVALAAGSMPVMP